MKQLLTLCLPCQKDAVLLGMKKRGFGVGRWNGFGGKVASNETVTEAALRELKEEVDIVPTEFKKVGFLEFTFADSEKVLEVHIYKINAFSGTPKESEEMKPAWFKTSEIPFKQMWSDDEFWLPHLLSGDSFKGKFHFDKPADEKHPAKILHHELEILENMTPKDLSA